MSKSSLSDCHAPCADIRQDGRPVQEETLSLYIADRFWRRLFGAYGADRLMPGRGVCLTPCGAVHTCWSRKTIDVVFLDRDGRELKCVQRLLPWRTAWCRGAVFAIELPQGYCAAHPCYLSRIHDALGMRGDQGAGGDRPGAQPGLPPG